MTSIARTRAMGDNGEDKGKGKRRRGRGEGSVEELPDGRWRAVLSLGQVNGRRVRRKFYGRTKKEALAKLREAQAQAGRGTLADAGKLTLGQWAEQ